ncbi:MAG: putative toxin-antitoxin system toxin component, PIN family [Bacteroidota bacterium]|nr:putative toxin-antitoxin system toxin component, PIN family [Bacteroidota bacterium]
MQNQKDRVVIDTNLWISFLLTKSSARLDNIIADSKTTLLLSHELIDEIVEVTQREKFRKYFPLDDVESFLIKIRNRAEFIKIQSIITDCRDPKDNFLLSLSIDGNATHLITGDKDLLIMKVYRDTRILTMAEYVSRL